MNVGMAQDLPRDIATVGTHIEACYLLILGSDSRLQCARPLVPSRNATLAASVSRNRLRVRLAEASRSED